jgi:hypothetical protein
MFSVLISGFAEMTSCTNSSFALHGIATVAFDSDTGQQRKPSQ